MLGTSGVYNTITMLGTSGNITITITILGTTRRANPSSQH